MTKNDGLGGAAKGAAAGAGFGAACWAATVPVVNFLGFTATGIASGSTAASMMSAAAIANGGGVAAGSTVAVLQSVGAVGLATPVGLGIVVGGTLIGGTAMLVKHALSTSSAEPADCWIVIECQSESDEPMIASFEDERSAREMYDVSKAPTKVLLAPEKKLVLTQGWQERLKEIVTGL